MIGLAGGFNVANDVIHEINAGDFTGVVVQGDVDHNVWNFRNVTFVGQIEIKGLGGNDRIYLSNKSDGVYRGGSGNDTFHIGSTNATFLYSGTNNGFDAFTGNNPGQTSTIRAEVNGTKIGLATPFHNGVDVIDRGDLTDIEIAAPNTHSWLNFSDVDFVGSQHFTIKGSSFNDTITTSLDRDGNVLYDGSSQSGA